VQKMVERRFLSQNGDNDTIKVLFLCNGGLNLSIAFAVTNIYLELVLF
jgi:hypothetical protein